MALQHRNIRPDTLEEAEPEEIPCWYCPHCHEDHGNWLSCPKRISETGDKE